MKNGKASSSKLHPHKLQRNQALLNFSCEGSKYFLGLESFSIAWFHKFYDVHVAIP